jgi:hypothetical protein
MLRSECSLDVPFEKIGTWWLLAQPEQKVRGVLKYSTAGISLALDGSFNSRSTANKDSDEQGQCVLGVTDDNEQFTLFKTYVNYSVGLAPQRDTLVALYMLAGEHTEDISTLGIPTAYFTAGNLDKFVDWKPFESKQGEHGDIHFTFKTPRTFEFQVESLDSTIGITCCFCQGGFGMNINLSVTSLFVMSPKMPQGLEWYVSHVWRVCDLLSLLTDEPTKPNSIWIKLPGYGFDICVVCPSWRPRYLADSDSPYPFLFRHENLEDSFPQIVEKWLTMNDTLKMATHLLRDGRHESGGTIETRFLLLCYAIEAFSRGTSGSEYVSESEYNQIYEALIAAIPASVKSDLRASLKKRIEFGNEYSLRKRIRTLLDSLEEETVNLVCRNRSDFVEGVVTSRNYLTHYADGLKSTTLTGSALSCAADKLLMLLRILFLKHVGIQEQLLRERISKHHRLLGDARFAKKQPECIKS